VDGIKHVWKSFQSSRVVHVKRDANSAAHWLAKEAVTHVIDAGWVEDISQIIYDIVSREFSVPNFFYHSCFVYPIETINKNDLFKKKSRREHTSALLPAHPGTIPFPDSTICRSSQPRYQP
jgi:hypothetical protein